MLNLVVYTATTGPCTVNCNQTPSLVNLQWKPCNKTFCSHTHTNISRAHYTAIRLNPNALRRSHKNHPPDQTMCQMNPAQIFIRHCSGLGLEIYNIPPMRYDKPGGRLVSYISYDLKHRFKEPKNVFKTCFFARQLPLCFLLMKNSLHRVVCLAQGNTWTDV